MRLCQLHRPVAAASSALSRLSVCQLQDALGQLRISANGTEAQVEGRRYASVRSQGAYKIRDTSTIPKKLGAKKTGDNYVIPGNIIYKQRGTIWYPGENCGMGRDHTIHALIAGYVKYYKDPNRHPDKQYIGVVHNREDKLPYPPHAMRKRKLNMEASPIPPPKESATISASGIPTEVRREGLGRKPTEKDARVFKLHEHLSYAYKEEPWRLGSLIRTEKRKMGSRRTAMKHRRRKKMAILKEMRRERADKIARRKEALDLERAAKLRKLRSHLARKKEEAAKNPGAEQTADGGQGPLPSNTGTDAGASDLDRH